MSRFARGPPGLTNGQKLSMVMVFICAVTNKSKGIGFLSDLFWSGFCPESQGGVAGSFGLNFKIIYMPITCFLVNLSLKG